MRACEHHTATLIPRDMATGARDQRQLDLADHLVRAVSLNLQQRRRQPRKAYPPPGVYPVASPVVPAHSSSSSACHSDVSTRPPLLMRGISSGTAVRLGQPSTLPHGSADLICHSIRPAVIAASNSLNGRATSAAAEAAVHSSTAQQRSKADVKGLKGYCNPARRLSGVESSERGPKQETTCFAQQLRSTQLGRTADDSEKSLNAPHPIAVSYSSTTDCQVPGSYSRSCCKTETPLDKSTAWPSLIRPYNIIRMYDIPGTLVEYCTHRESSTTLSRTYMVLTFWHAPGTP